MNFKSNLIDQDFSNDDMVKIISQHEVFSGFSPKEMNQLSSIVSFRSVKESETIFEIDDTPDYIFYLLEGALNLHFPDNSKLHILPNELIGEIGVLNGDFRLGKLVAKTDSKLIAICTTNLFNPNIINSNLSLAIIKRLSKRVTNYLRSLQHVSSREIISNGENEYVEFKSTLRWNLKADKKDERITHAAMKTIAAFLNSDGGILMVGVSDDGTLLGLKSDRFENEDKALLFLTHVIKSRLGTLHLENIFYHIEQINDKTILRVDVQAGNTPCYFSDGKIDHLYIRTGPSTTDLRLSEVYNFVKKRFS